MSGLNNEMSREERIFPYIEKMREGDIEAKHIIEADAGVPRGTIDRMKRELPRTIKAAKSGNADAMIALGRFYAYGSLPGVNIDIDKAVYWLERASKKTHSALYDLGQIYFTQYKDFDKGIAMMKKAAAVGVPGATRKEIREQIRLAEEEKVLEEERQKLLEEQRKIFFEVMELLISIEEKSKKEKGSEES